jgi:hypothetical protein
MRRLRQAGAKTTAFSYWATFERVDSIVARLRERISLLAKADGYVVVGHSLGGVLLRAAINSLPPDMAPPRLVYLLGSPIGPSRLAVRLQGNVIFRVLTQDCGQLLGSTERMAAVGSISAPTMAIAGVRGLVSWQGLFGSELNDGVVSISEVSAPWLPSPVPVPVVHTLLPSAGLVVEIILQGLAQQEG